LRTYGPIEILVQIGRSMCLTFYRFFLRLRVFGLLLALMFSSSGASAQRINFEGIVDNSHGFSRSWVDINNDGKDDFCAFAGANAERVECYLSTGSNFDPNRVIFNVDGYLMQRFWWIDVNGDGQVDLCRVKNRVNSVSTPVNIQCRLGPTLTAIVTASVPGRVQTWTCPISPDDCAYVNTSAGIDNESDLFFADVNQDGTSDVCYLSTLDGLAYELRCLLFSGGAFSASAGPGWIRALAAPGNRDYPRGFYDVNGDGYPDFCRLDGGIACILGSSSGFSSTGTMDVSIPGISQYGAAFVDINGDGKTDLCRVNETPGYLACRLSTGKAWEATDRVSSAISSNRKDYRYWVDINGDGLPDFCRAVGDDPDFGKSNLWCRLARGGDSVNGLFAPQDIKFDDSATATVDFGRKEGGRAFCDATGSGIQTLCRFTYRQFATGGDTCFESENGPYCYPAVAAANGIAVGVYGGIDVSSIAKDEIQARPSLIGAFTDGLGAETRITHLPLSNPLVYAKSGAGTAFPRLQISQPRSPIVFETRAWRAGANVTLTGTARYFYKDLRVDNQTGSRGFRERWFLTEGANALEYTLNYQGLGPTVDASSLLDDTREIGQAKEKRLYAIDPLQIPDTIANWTPPPGANARQKKLAATMRQATTLPSAMSTTAVSPPTPASPFMLLKRSTSTLGETTSNAGTAAQPHPRFRPVVSTHSEAWDWNDRTAIALPVADGTSKTSYYGNVLELTETTTQGSQVWNKKTTNVYGQDNTAAWILGRLTSAKVESTSPTVATQLAATPTSYGTSPNANTTSLSASTVVTLSPPAFASTAVGQTSTATATLSNNAGSPLVIVPPAASSVTGQGLSFVSTTCGSQLAAGATCTVTLRFAPTAAGSVPGTVAVDTASGPRVASFDATSPAPVTTATMTSTAPNLGSVWYGAAAPTASVALRNDGNVPMTLTGLSGLSTRFQVTANTCTSIAPTASCSMTISMPTTAAGSTPNTVTTAGATNNASFTINGTVNSAVSRWSVTTLAFGNVYNGQTTVLSVTLYNDGFGLAANWNAALANLPAGFTANMSACAAVAPGGNCSVPITFAPTAVQAYSGSNIRPGTVSFTSNTLAMSGSGVAATTTLTASPTSLNFGTVPKPGWSSMSVTIQNSGGLAATGLNYTVTPTTGTNAYYSVNRGTCPVAGGSLAAGASCALTVTFTTQCVFSFGVTVTGTLTISGSNLTASRTVPLTGSTSADNSCY
jgi:hypothetical protein